MNKKELIIKSALKVFAQKGYGPVSLEEIAREAELAKGTIYLYFRDKEDLVHRTILFVLDTIEKAVRRNLNDASSPTEILEKIAFNYLNVFRKNNDFFGFFFILSDPDLVSNREKLFAALCEKRNRLVSFETSIIEEAQNKGIFKKEPEAREIAHLFNGMVSGAIHRLKFNNPGEDFDINKTVGSLMKVLLNGIREEL